MVLTLTQSEKEARIVVKGEIDERGAEELKRRFAEIKLTPGIGVALDFAGVTHIGSAGIGKLLLFYKTVASYGGTVRIERVEAHIYDLLQQLKLGAILTITK